MVLTETLSVAVPSIPLSEAVIVVEPDATPVARPLEFIVATAGVPDFHVAVVVTFPLVPSL
jgi:hypothetical protein